MQSSDAHEQIRKRYQWFAQQEAQGHSPLYEQLAYAVAENEALIEFLTTLPTAKQQPNLLFGAYRLHCGLASSAQEFSEQLLGNQALIRQTMLEKSTQTNESARCATLLPVLAQLPQPLALLEVGASAGLCLYPDRYGYEYGGLRLLPESAGPEVPVFTCAASDNTPLPATLPQVVWRRGIDLNPLDVTNESEMSWLEQLIWPEQTQRVENLRRAVAVAKQMPPQISQGDLLTLLPEVANDAPGDATLVVFHSAVLAYVTDQSVRDQFVDQVSKLDAVWLSNEHPAVFPDISGKAPEQPPFDRFLLAKDGVPIATTGPHGQSIEWFG